MTSIRRRPTLAWLALFVAFLATPAAGRQSASDNERDAAELAQVLGIRPGSTVAEIGAGDGSLTIAISRIVGEAGRVIATELGDDRVARLKRAIETAGVTNVHVLRGDETKTNLDTGCCDAVFMRNVYHHFDDPGAMNESLFQSLRPGGTIAVIDFTPPPGRPAPAPKDRDVDGTHGVAASSVADELKRAGFEVAATEQANERRVLVVAKKPGLGP